MTVEPAPERPVIAAKPAYEVPDLDGIRRDAEGYRAMYRDLAKMRGADWGAGGWRVYQNARERFSKDDLLLSLTALRGDGYGATLSLNATLSQGNVEKGLNLARNPQPTRGAKPVAAGHRNIDYSQFDAKETM